MDSAPIELVFYSGDDEVIKTYSRARVPSYLLDMAIELQATMRTAEDENANSDAIFDFVVEFYSKDKVPQFTRDELKLRSDLNECMSVLLSVITRAGNLTRKFAKGNPTVPSPKKK